ncbi:MAG TPA: radical SAM protein [Armatimonadota bacterium]|nr:radical SAM protein [Armatimonadota bacterium]
MKFLLVHPPMDGSEPPVRRTEGLGLAYVAAVLRRDGHEVEMLDGYLRRLRPRALIREILRRDFDCLGITASDVHKWTTISIARAVRKRRKDALIVAGGYFPTFHAQRLLTVCPEFDFLVRGEGETVVSEGFGRIARGEDWRETPGLAFRQDGTEVLNPLPPLVHDLDSLPFPARDELKLVGQGMPALIVGSRGCNHRCSFCSIPSFYALSGRKAPRSRSPRNVLDEIEEVTAATGIKEFVFADDNFIGPGTKNRERVFQFAEEIRSRKLDFAFTIQCRVDEIDEEILKLLKDVGLFRVYLGVESSVERQLHTYNKRTTAEQNRRAIELIRRVGLDLQIGFIMLDPYTTLKEMLENMQFLDDMDLKEFRRNMLRLQYTPKLGLYGGVPLIEQVRADGLLRKKGFDCEFVFKDPQFRLIYGAAQALGAPLGFLARLYRLVRS